MSAIRWGPVADFDKRTRCRELTFGARSSILDRFDFCAGLAAGFFLSGKDGKYDD